MINVFFNSIAGKKKNEEINTILVDLLSQDYINKNDKRTIKYALEVVEQGAYPSKDYFADFYESSHIIKSISEIKSYVNLMKDFYAKELVVHDLMQSVNESNSLKDLVDKVSNIVEASVQYDEQEDEDDGPRTYSDMGKDHRMLVSYVEFRR